MGFYDSYEPSSNLLSGDDKDALIASGITFEITGVRQAKTRFGESFFVDVVIDDEEKTLAFKKGSVYSRDDLLSNMAIYLESEGAEPLPPHKLIQSGQAKTLVRADI